MLVSAVEVLRERGAAGLTIDAVLERSGAPRGSVYHHFPGGRSQILREALQFAGAEITAQVDQAADVSAIALLRQIVALWSDVLVDSDYTAGSPVLAAALGWGQDEQELTAVAADIFRRWRDAARAAYVRQGLSATEATGLAHTTIAALEGAVVLSRSMRSLDPLNDVARELEFLIKAREFVARELR
ncbi:MAG TPA: TetR/AcrR family transcriptional regulator [Mycobacterium sp.]|uniref:TetR/AcrR family transcriptional regulator n=1 Tax=Mycolicibacterium sp. TaxID=2320850 RepID=UPI0025F1C11B|nr:TetR/AcrR family transcriptional regulator [Mycolicibacterium sp.]HPX37185.1 TetR/AcrR family transcriptional regulator [Mycobacterium sp.]HQC77290.1 TetR/AcrR family transcriptional regulator [Mycobacterium sp.]